VEAFRKSVPLRPTISARLTDAASLEHPNAIAPVSRSFNYGKDLAVDLGPYTVAVLEIRAE
jgi:alpha-N-arabinofuranosidase